MIPILLLNILYRTTNKLTDQIKLVKLVLTSHFSLTESLGGFLLIVVD